MEIKYGKIIQESISITRDNAKLLFPALAILLLPATLFQIGLQWFTDNDVDPNISTGAAAGLTAGALIGVVVMMVFWGLAQAVTLIVAVDAISGKAVTLGEAFRKGFARLGPLFVAITLQSMAVGFAFMMCLIPGFIVWPALALVVPVVVTEQCSGSQSISRSWSLTDGYRRPILSAFFAVGILSTLVGVAINLISTGALLPEKLSTGSLLLQQGLSYLTGIAFGSLFSVMAALFYVRIKEEREGVDVAELAAVFD